MYNIYFTNYYFFLTIRDIFCLVLFYLKNKGMCVFLRNHLKESQFMGRCLRSPPFSLSSKIVPIYNFFFFLASQDPSKYIENTL